MLTRRVSQQSYIFSKAETDNCTIRSSIPLLCRFVYFPKLDITKINIYMILPFLREHINAIFQNQHYLTINFQSTVESQKQTDFTYRPTSHINQKVFLKFHTNRPCVQANLAYKPTSSINRPCYNSIAHYMLPRLYDFWDKNLESVHSVLFTKCIEILLSVYIKNYKN